MDTQTRTLCLAFMRADTEAQVIALLKQHGYWDNASAWRLYGDRENNYSAIGNQQSRAEAALVEKIVNGIDARLLYECLVRGIEPESPQAPPSIREAVVTFFEAGKLERPPLGLLRTWPDDLLREAAKGLTLAATGARPPVNPSITIADHGEGQSPRRFPDTFLSLEKSNKLRIPFVQGKFNMGSTGALEFCGQQNIQLILSRRAPALLKQSEQPTDGHWGFTIVRRSDPHGNRRSSLYEYLAPVGSDLSPGKGQVLSFAADTMPIFPDGPVPYARESAWGTLVKLYEYAIQGRSNILMRDGLLRRLDVLLPEIALPVRLHECRYSEKGKKASHENTMTGFSARLGLDEDRSENMEQDFPSTAELTCNSERMVVTIYAFKKDTADTYRKNEGVIFVVNGQTHGYLTQDFFRRGKVAASYLADSLLVMVDCSAISGRGRELLFMNSRDKLRDSPLRRQIEDALEDLLRQHDGLRQLRERRRREEIESKMKDSAPLASVIERLIRQSPTLASLFQTGQRISNPFKTETAASEDKPYVGQQYPTYFHFKGKQPGDALSRNAHLGARCRITFETDASNDYFRRAIDPGTLELREVRGDQRHPVSDHHANPFNGIVTLSFSLPPDAKEGDTLDFEITVTDATRTDPFVNHCKLLVQKELRPGPGSGGRRNPPKDARGDERDVSAGLDIPKPIPVTEEEWSKKGFDQYTALVIKGTGEEATNGERRAGAYDFFINEDNLHLKRYLKYEVKERANDRVARTRFEVGMVLVGLAVLHEEQTKAAAATEEIESSGTMSVERRVSETTRALAPFLLPTIDMLGALNSEDIEGSTASGEAT